MKLLPNYSIYIFKLVFFKVSNYYDIFSKADQLVTERISGAEHTKLDEDFQKLEKATDVHIELQVVWAQIQTHTLT